MIKTIFRQRTLFGKEGTGEQGGDLQVREGSCDGLDIFALASICAGGPRTSGDFFSVADFGKLNVGIFQVLLEFNQRGS
jgi:hypothetical protein